jgi:hypothetical protein
MKCKACPNKCKNKDNKKVLPNLNLSKFARNKQKIFCCIKECSKPIENFDKLYFHL